MPKIIVKINKKTGQPIIETEGFSGTSCEKATEAIKSKFGKIGEVMYKDEYYEAEQTELTEGELV